MTQDLTVPVPATQTAIVAMPAQSVTPATPAIEQPTAATPKPVTAEQIEAFMASDRRQREEIFKAKLDAERFQRENHSIQSEYNRLREVEASLKDPARRYQVMEQYGGDVVNYAEAVAKGIKVSPTEELAQLREKIKMLEDKTTKVESGMSAGMYARNLDKVISDPKFAPLVEYSKLMQKLNGTSLNLEGAAQEAIRHGLSPEDAASQMLEYATSALGSIKSMFAPVTPTPTPTPSADPVTQANTQTITNAMETKSAPVSTKRMTYEEREKAAMDIARQYDREHQ